MIAEILILAKNKNIDVELLRTFIAVVDNGSITRTSAQIYRTQSAISMQIKRLEQQIGQQLFDRSGRHLTLTYHGKSLVGYSRRLLTLHDEAINQITNEQQSQHLTIGCPDDYSANLLPKLINIFIQQEPKLHISVITANSGELRRQMDQGNIDVAVLTRLPESNEGVVIYQSHAVWLANDPDIFDQRPLPLALFEPSCKFHSSVIDGLEKNNIDYQLCCDASQTQLLISLARQYNMVTVIPELSVPLDMIGRKDISGLPQLPMAEVIVCFQGGIHRLVGLSLGDITSQMN